MKAKKPTLTQKRLIGMLTENTGKHFLDSGGAYGRNWERNRHKNFLDSPGFYVDIDNHGMSATFNVFWYLSEYLKVTKDSERLNRKLKRALKKGYEDGEFEMNIMEEFVSEHDDGEGYNTTGANVNNTYNYETLLSQVLQYCTFHTEQGTFIALQIHGGCDIRGGYTSPQIFEVTGEMDYFLMAQSNMTAWEQDSNNAWDSDNCGYSFYASNNEPDFKDVVIYYGGAAYNRLTGNQIIFGNMNYQQEIKEPAEVAAFFGEVRQYVRDIYVTSKDIIGDVIKRFVTDKDDLPEFFEQVVINSAKAEMKAIESHTAKLDLI